MANNTQITVDGRRAIPGRREAHLPAAADHSLIGNSQAMQQVRETIRRIGRRKSPVLIQGPTGSGKELVARAIHRASGRSGRFVAINVAALTDSLFEAELFGHIRGAFSGAAHDRIGLFRSAAGGTVFLDEIGELQPSLQAKLLRVLDEHEVWPVGSDVGIRVDLRVIAATNVDLDARMRDGMFRQDLFYRLQGAHVTLCSLHERSEDIPLLVTHFLERIALEHDETPLVVLSEALEMLQRYPWPGNVRELQQVLGRLAGEIDTRVVDLGDVRRVLSHPKKTVLFPDRLAAERSIAEFRTQLEEYQYDIEAVARVLRVAPSTVYRRMHRLGIPVGPRGPRPKKLHYSSR